MCGADGGVIYVFEKSDDKDYYKKAKAFRIENNAVKIKQPPRRLALSERLSLEPSSSLSSAAVCMCPAA